MSRRLHTWKIRSRALTLGDRTLVMGVLNVTPDSFSDGGQYLDPDRAYARAMEMEEQGADIIDIGAESTRPGAEPISAAEELQRLAPVLKRLRGKLSIPISVDTYKAEVAERALELDAEIINDPSGFTLDPILVKPVIQFNAGVIFNHMRGRPTTWATLAPLSDVMGSIVKDLDASVSRARRAGVERARILVDPGLGFGKRREQNFEILSRLEELSRLELPIMVGPSRKSFFAASDDATAEFSTAAAVTAGIFHGAHIVRVHNVAAMKSVIAVADEIARFDEKLQEARRAAVAEAPPRDRRTPIRVQGQAQSKTAPVRPPVQPNIKEPPSPERAPALPPTDRREDRPSRPAMDRGPSWPEKPFRPGKDFQREQKRPFRSKPNDRSPNEGRSNEGRSNEGRSNDERPKDGRSFGPRPGGPRKNGFPPKRNFGSGAPRPFRSDQQGDRPTGPFRGRPDARSDSPRADGQRPFAPRGKGPGKPAFGKRPDGGKPFSGPRSFGPRKGKGGPPRGGRPRPRREE